MRRLITTAALIFTGLALAAGCSRGKCAELGKLHCMQFKLNAEECAEVKQQLDEIPSGTCEAVLFGIEKRRSGQ